MTGRGPSLPVQCSLCSLHRPVVLPIALHMAPALARRHRKIGLVVDAPGCVLDRVTLVPLGVGGDCSVLVQKRGQLTLESCTVGGGTQSQVTRDSHSFDQKQTIELRVPMAACCVI